MKVLVTLALLTYYLSGRPAQAEVTPELLYPSYDLLDQAATNESVVLGLLERLVPFEAGSFKVVIDRNVGPRDTFQLRSVGSKIEIRGTSAIAASLGLNHYLKHFCQAHVSWTGDQLNLPNPLPIIRTTIKVSTNGLFRYYQNVCTVSYSMVWWDWERWEREIDWMALNGINMPLAFGAQEAIWARVYHKMGFSDEEIDEYFSGPAFLAWNRMGNFQSFAGPLSKSWHQQQVALQHQILRRMREYGMIPALPAFAGRVLPSFSSHFPEADVTKETGHWGKFDEPYCCTSFLSPRDQMFLTVGKNFLQEYYDEFGTNHLYSADLFNEMIPPSSDLDYLSSCGKAVYSAMISIDPKAVWLMQGWLFLNTFWNEDKARALLTSVPLGNMIVLDLEAEFYPQYARFESFYGQPFIWSIIQNFGGVNGLYGALDSINEGLFKARDFPNSTLIGSGLSPEGIEKNDVVFELANEMGWRKQPVDLDEWISEFAVRRYGFRDERLTQAWKLLRRSVYSARVPNIDHGKYILVTRPSLKRTPLIWYDPEDVAKAFELLLEVGTKYPELTQTETFKYDSVDISRQILQIYFGSFHTSFVQSFHEKDVDRVRSTSASMLELLDLLDKLLATNKHFLLSIWTSSAKSWASNLEEEMQYEYNARNQISLWGPTGQILDYGNKQWSGVVSGYYKPRWALFFNYTLRCLLEGKPFNQDNFNKLCLWFAEEPFTFRTSDDLPTEEQGETFSVMREIKNFMHRPPG